MGRYGEGGRKDVIHGCGKLWFAGALVAEQRMLSLSYLIAIVVLKDREQLWSYVFPHTCTHS